MRRIINIKSAIVTLIGISMFFCICIPLNAKNDSKPVSNNGVKSVVDEQELVPEGSTSDGMQVVSKGLKADPVTNDITYTTVDKQRTSETYYTTYGFTIADAYVDEKGNLVETGNGEIVVKLDAIDGIATANSKQQISGTVATSSWTISYSALLDAIKSQFPAWYERLTDNKSGESVALKLDALIGFHIEGEVLTDDNGKPLLADKSNLDYYKKKYPWFANYSDNHYNKGLVKYYAEKVETGEMSEEDMHKLLNGKMIGKKAPSYYTFNWNREGQFDLGDAIPTSENVDNGYKADAWWGYALVNSKDATHEWTFGGNVNWSYEKEVGTGEIDEVTLKEKTVTVTVNRSATHTHTVSRKVGYWFLTAANFWDLSSVKDENQVFPSGVHSFNSKIDVNMECYINDTNLGTTADYEAVPDDDKHVNWTAAYDGALTYNTPVMDSQEEAEAYFDKHVESLVLEPYKIPVKNDTLVINGKTYMNGAWHEYKNGENAKNEGETWAYSAISDGDYLFDRETQTTRQTGDNVKIPSSIKNRNYYTKITVTYDQKITPSGPYTESKDSGSAILNEMSPTGFSYPSQEPIRVHTPVVSPVVILDPNTGEVLEPSAVPEYRKPQLVDGSKEGFGDRYNDNADYQLLLDGSYKIRFTPEYHMEHIGYKKAADNNGLNTSIYNRYTKRRYVCFPFTVQVNGKVYYPNDTTSEATDNSPAKKAGYTEWIEVYKDDSDGHDEDTVDFYVPTWAIEGDSYTVYYEVVPENATKEDFDAYEEYIKNDDDLGGGRAANTELFNYIARYKMEVQLSGWIYDFQVAGINEKDIFDGYTVTKSGNEVASGISNGVQNFAFCPKKQEKKQGNRNRIGGTSVRYTFDGSLTNNWSDANTLPFAVGSSLAYKNSGVLRRGDTFNFTVRTISNLWDEKGDEMYIVPSFRYVSYDGSVVEDNINVYYTKVTDKKTMEFVKFGSDQDLSAFDNTKIADPKFRGSFYQVDASLNRTLHALQQDDADFSKDIANGLLYELRHPDNPSWPRDIYKSAQLYLSKNVPCSTLSSIRLTSELRLLTGNLEQLEQNLDKQGASNLTYVKTKDANGVPYDITKTSEPETWNDFRKSMQTWFGAYTIPSKIYVTSKDVDVWDYASEHGYVKGNEDIFYKPGYLILNFDIYTMNNGKWHLTYHGSGGKDQWKLQGAKNTAIAGDPTLNHDITVGLVPGDVAVIDMGQSKFDDYEVGIYVNN